MVDSLFLKKHTKLPFGTFKVTWECPYLGYAYKRSEVCKI